MSKINLAFVLVAAASFASTDLLADTGSNSEPRQELGMPYAGKTDQRGTLVLPAFSPEQLEELEGRGRDDNHVEGPAPSVTYFEVYAVGSSYIGWEYVGQAQFSTSYDHGGALLRVAVLQYGYGTGGATLNGASGDNDPTEHLCGTLANLHYCSVGETITAFMRYYSFDGVHGGSFDAFTHSSNYPWNTETDWINIQ